MLQNFNIEDFDEEISGINLSKLFSVYGPNSTELKKFNKARDKNGGIKNPKEKGYSSRVRSSGASTKRDMLGD